MKSIIDAIEQVFPVCNSLDFKDTNELFGTLYVLGIFGYEKTRKRIYDPVFGDDADDLSFVDYAANLFDTSRSEIRRSIKGRGIKVNNIIPNENLLVRDLPWIKIGDWKVCVIKRGKNEFDFILS